eukprot:gnl/TRDRNA2_/TRDRNA2_180514_c0_seq1.p1 gnl/TRDRNA2_/TRDRNA2_180514_c0~~gnl/TRDRNA2_/TRDRNA2_180514_c0_seq1.p1  ORF type:complete len:109 (+),score=0.45 gnl/TRDRNA2_/TRDRNA2_180514_c0_seq1:3-329(+)
MTDRRIGGLPTFQMRPATGVEEMHMLAQTGMGPDGPTAAHNYSSIRKGVGGLDAYGPHTETYTCAKRTLTAKKENRKNLYIALRSTSKGCIWPDTALYRGSAEYSNAF